MNNWEMLFEEIEEENPEWGFEKVVREMVRQETGYDCEKKQVLGRSGNHYEVDAVPLIRGRQRSRLSFGSSVI